MLLSDVLCTGRSNHQVIPPPWPLRLSLRFALSADLQNPDRPWRSTPGSVSAAFATKRGMTWEPRAFQVCSSPIACHCPTCYVPAVETTRSLPPPRRPQQLLLRCALSADLQGSNRPRRSIPGCVPAAFATNRGLGATRVSGMLLPCCFTVLQRRHWRPSVSGLVPPPPPLPALTHVRAEPITVTVPRPPQSRVTDIGTK